MKKLTGTLQRLLHRVRHQAVDQSLSDYQRPVEQINRRGLEFVRRSDEELKSLAREVRRRSRKSSLTNELVIDAFAVVREAAKRTLGLCPYDVQVLAALALHDERIVEMGTGEGKTLAAVLPACLHAFRGRRVHVLTFNDYLSQRDAQWMGPIYRYFDLTVGCVVQSMTLPIEGQCFEVRRTLRRYSYALEKQRRTMEQLRRAAILFRDPAGLKQKEPERYRELVARFGLRQRPKRFVTSESPPQASI